MEVNDPALIRAHVYRHERAELSVIQTPRLETSGGLLEQNRWGVYWRRLASGPLCDDGRDACAAQAQPTHPLELGVHNCVPAARKPSRCAFGSMEAHAVVELMDATHRPTPGQP